MICMQISISSHTPSTQYRPSTVSIVSQVLPLPPLPRYIYVYKPVFMISSGQSHPLFRHYTPVATPQHVQRVGAGEQQPLELMGRATQH